MTGWITSSTCRDRISPPPNWPGCSTACVPPGSLMVNMTSASGGSLDALRKPGRIVISATKSGTEKNATVFARYWVEALRDPAADTDKNETVSALEAFRYAQRKTGAFYESEKRLATEHAVLDEGGKPEASLAAAFPVVRFGAHRRPLRAIPPS